VKNVQSLQHPLDADSYAKLAEPSVRNPAVYYSSVRPHLFEYVMGKYTHTGANNRKSQGR
jgi:hypothetical protein